LAVSGALLWCLANIRDDIRAIRKAADLHKEQPIGNGAKKQMAYSEDLLDLTNRVAPKKR
jgi:hypothetical protein